MVADGSGDSILAHTPVEHLPLAGLHRVIAVLAGALPTLGQVVIGSRDVQWGPPFRVLNEVVVWTSYRTVVLLWRGRIVTPPRTGSPCIEDSELTTSRRARERPATLPII